MPTYEYECRSCGHHFEKYQTMIEKPVRRCPCCSGRVDRLIGPGAGVIFRGSGFHVTDYRSESYRKAQERDKTAAGAGSGSKDSAGKKDKASTTP